MTNPDDMLAEYLAANTTRLHRKRVLREDLRRRMTVNIGQSEGVVKEIVRYLQERPELEVVALFSALPGELDQVVGEKGVCS